MKLHDVRKEYGLDQAIFYGWMIEQKLIEETDKGYVIGPNALEGMSTVSTSYLNDTGQNIDRVQVMIKDPLVPTLIRQYENTGREEFYTDKSESSTGDKTISELKDELTWADKRIDVLENQVKLLTSQMKLLMNHVRTKGTKKADMTMRQRIIRDKMTRKMGK